MLKPIINGAVAGLLLTVASATSTAQVTLNIDAASRGPRIGSLHYGIFYEEINNAGDGGIYAELIRNRSFEDGNNLEYWTATSGCKTTVLYQDLLNDAQFNALNLTLTGASQGLTNTGYWGINCVAGDTYTFSMWVKSSEGYDGNVTVSLVDKDNTEGATVTIPVKATGSWSKVTATMTATKSIPTSTFSMKFDKSGQIAIDMVSLFPPTYKDRPNGCRRDLALMLEALKPAFVRFPGGCYIEGDGTVEDNRRFEWKKTIGPVEERPGHYNYNWGYPCTDGMGFHEFLQLTEDLGAEPLFVVNIGIGHGWYKDYTDIDEYIQEALDAIEYCNGDATTEWGAKRVANGHPEPFNLRLLEIGNENYNFDDDRSDHYAERYKAFYDAIKAKYPEVTLIGNVEAWGTNEPSWRNSYHCEIVDEHYYRSPEWFVNQYNKYDNYDRATPKVYVGEYAVTEQFGVRGHLRAALGEAVYMMGMERNSDHVIMNSYAPIFMNEERGGGWNPDMIRFDHQGAYGTPSYWVQQLMPNNVGKQNVLWTEDNNLLGAGSKIALSSWATKVKYDNVKVTDADGNVLLSEDFSDPNTTKWAYTGSEWKIENGELVQTNGTSQGTFFPGNVDFPSAYTLELDAVKVSGAEGFLIGFNYADNWNYSWWNIGGWNNGQHGLQLCRNNGKTDINLKAGTVETGRTYHIKIEVDGTKVKCWLDGQLIHDVTMPVDRRVFVSSTIDDDTNTMFLKIANVNSEAQTVNIKLSNAGIDNAAVTVLTSSTNTAENSMSDPMNVSPAEGTMGAINGNTAVYEAPAYSLSIIKLSLNNINYSESDDKPLTEAQKELITEELRPTASKLSFLHASTSLPVTTASGATIEWNLKEPGAGLNVTSSRFSSLLEISGTNTGDKKKLLGTLVATVTFPDGSRGDIEFDVYQAPADGMYGYLYAHMNPSTETTNYALATKESLGKKFASLINGKEVFPTEELAPIEKGTRDPYLARGQRPDEYLMTTTDMCNRNSGKWENHGIDLLRSGDLVHWESTAFDFNLGKKIFSDPDATADVYKTDADYASIIHVWAPQFIWDPDGLDGKGGYLVYYSLLHNRGGDHDRIFYSYADRDFKTLTQPRLFYDPGYAVIDADIVYSEYDGLYHMMIKKEGASAAETGIFEYTSPTLLNGQWKEVMHMKAEGNGAVEGPTMIRRIDEDAYNLYYMRYDDGNYKYRVVDLDHMGLNYSSSSALAGDGNFQHGSMIYVNEEEYNMLATWSEVVNNVDKAKRLIASSGTTVFDKALELADKALGNKTVSSLAAALPEALQALLVAHGEFMAIPDEFSDITSQLVNPDFTGNSREGWTSFGDVREGVAENWNRTFDNYQILKNMPAGSYRLEVQGFYRCGYQAESRQAHKDGTEQLLAVYYMNGNSAPFMSLYDEPDQVPDNMTEANRAFNTQKHYNNLPLYTVLNEMGDLRVGIRKTRTINGDWCCVDNFKLFYNPDPAAGVEEIEVELNPDADAVYYNLQGVRVENPAHGFFIRSGKNPAKVLIP